MLVSSFNKCLIACPWAALPDPPTHTEEEGPTEAVTDFGGDSATPLSPTTTTPESQEDGGEDPLQPTNRLSSAALGICNEAAPEPLSWLPSPVTPLPLSASLSPSPRDESRSEEVDSRRRSLRVTEEDDGVSMAADGPDRRCLGGTKRSSLLFSSSAAGYSVEP